MASDDHGFWVVWNDGSTATHLAMANVDPTGLQTPVAITGSGGTAIDYNLVTMGGAVELVWVERGGDDGGGIGSNLWLVPACRPS